MAFFANTCWPTRFLARWLAVFLGAVVLGVVLGAWRRPKLPPPPPPRPPVRVQVNLRAVEVYADGAVSAVPARVTTGGTGDRAIAESDQGALSVNPKRPTAISRVAGSRLWLIFAWRGDTERRLINPWPQSTITYKVEFRLNRPNPHTAR